MNQFKSNKLEGFIDEMLAALSEATKKDYGQIDEDIRDRIYGHFKADLGF